MSSYFDRSKVLENEYFLRITEIQMQIVLIWKQMGCFHFDKPKDRCKSKNVFMSD